MFRKLIKKHPYLPAIAGLACAIGFEVAFTFQELKGCKGLGCDSSLPWHLAVLPLIFLIGGAAWTGKELFKQWRKLLKQPG
jgi:hypothetical protein